MTGLQILGGAMIALFLAALFVTVARIDGWQVAASAFAGSILTTAFVAVGVALLTGVLG